MAKTLLHQHLTREGANHGSGKGCPCCCSVKTERDRQAARQKARRVEERTWRNEATE
jgi:hypothetical protein